jgi:hypothetical protein
MRRVNVKVELTIYVPGDSAWCPLDSVGVPIGKASSLVYKTTLIVFLRMAISINNIATESLWIRCRYNLDINLVPLALSPVGPIPVQKERLHGSLRILCLHPCLESSILESFLCLHLGRAVGLSRYVTKDANPGKYSLFKHF